MKRQLTQDLEQFTVFEAEASGRQDCAQVIINLAESILTRCYCAKFAT